ncbi:MAG: type II restriction endonuclease subunit M [Rehaibacterium terrae]|uniref:type II restriction endonuclease subunit M n=1 Tax=Rehaibacterium terrae TaxID=1341696 RepID=UPI00391B44FD
MTTFLRLLAENDKREALATACTCLRAGEPDPRVFDVAPIAFDAVPGKPFAYWVSDAVRQTFQRLPPFESEGRTVRVGLQTGDDFRFVRAWWEVHPGGTAGQWFPFAKGGAYSPFYADVYLVVNWARDGAEMDAFSGSVIRNPDYYFRPGLTWPRRTQGGLSLRAMPQGCIFADKGPAAFVADDAPDALLALLVLVNSQAFGLLVSLQMAFGSYEVGVIQKTPVPELSAAQQSTLAALARRAWSLKRALDTTEETSHAFLLPAALRARLGDYDPPAIEGELAHIQAEIDAIAFDLYGFSEADRAAAQSQSAQHGDAQEAAEDEDAEEAAAPVDTTAGLLSWAVGVAFSRFDWRLATGERVAPPEPEPFDPLPAKSPGMLPDGAAPFHAHPGILVDDPGHPHDLARLVEEVLVRVDVPVPDDVRRWLQRDFFPFHLQRYSKSRRKAPIYWPLSTTSGSYTLWVYYPSLSSQTLYTAINDFVEPKLKQVGAEVTALRNKGSARTRDDEKQFEALQAFELELIELRDTLLKLAPTYKPNHDDGVQISAAPLWPLFRHKPWQKVLKDTWEKLAKGDYDWAKLAMNYWPERVREKCKTDKSLAIAHGLEELFEEPEAKPKKTRKRKGEA